MKKLARLFSTLHEIKAGLTLSARFYLFQPDAAEKMDKSREAAWRSFTVYWLTVPFGLASSWLFDRVYLAAYGVNKPLYFAYAIAGSIVSTFLSILLAYKISKMEGVEANFPRYVTAINWGSLWWLIASVPLIALVQSGWLAHEQIAMLGNSLFVLSMVYGWFFGWRALAVNPLVAMGVAVAASAPAGIISDFIDLRLYHVVRPFFAQ